MDIKPGNYVTFKVLIAYRWARGRRKVHTVDDESVTVTFNGLKNFIVYHDEITKVEEE